jgi:ABC-type dipeptide/oligopeptide/nickel transport system ATPase subunit
MLKTEKLAAGCGDVQVLWDIDIEINEGEMVAIVGSNGAGKSTLLGALSGLVQIKGGRFSFEEEELTNESSEKLADPPEVVGFYAPGVLAILIQHLAVSLASLAVIRERLSGAYEFFEVSPLGPGELLAGQFLTYLGLVLGVNLAVAAALAAFLGIPVAAGTPEELRRRAFGGESIELTLGGEPSGLPGRLEALQEIGDSVEIRQEKADTSRIRLLVDDADARLPGVLKALDGANVRSADIPKPSFNEVYFRLMHETEESTPATKAE